MLVDALADYLCSQRGLALRPRNTTLLADYVASGARANPKALQGLLPRREAPATGGGKGLAQRQERHGAAQRMEVPVP